MMVGEILTTERTEILKVFSVRKASVRSVVKWFRGFMEVAAPGSG
jgi:hypothetical protein